MATHGRGKNNVGATVSLPKEMHEKATERRKRLRFRSFSAYVQELIYRDLEERPAFVLKEQGSPAKSREIKSSK